MKRDRRAGGEREQRGIGEGQAKMRQIIFECPAGDRSAAVRGLLPTALGVGLECGGTYAELAFP